MGMPRGSNLAGLLNKSLTSALVCLSLLALMSGWSGTGSCNGDYIIPAAFPGQWLNRMAAEAELDRPSSFSLQHLHGGVGVRKRTPELYDEAEAYSIPAGSSSIVLSTSANAANSGKQTYQRGQQQQQQGLVPRSSNGASPLITSLSISPYSSPESSPSLMEELDEPKIIMSKRTALFMDKLMVALHNAISGNGRVPSGQVNSQDFEVVQRQKNTMGAQQLTAPGWSKPSRKCYFNAVTCYGKRRR